jgi:hypothetical protein
VVPQVEFVAPVPFCTDLHPRLTLWLRGRIRPLYHKGLAKPERESVMRTQDTLLTRLGIPMPPLCLRCDAPMRIKTITPTMFTTTIDEVEFRCPDCKSETTKSIRRS